MLRLSHSWKKTYAIHLISVTPFALPDLKISFLHSSFCRPFVARLLLYYNSYTSNINCERLVQIKRY